MSADEETTVDKLKDHFGTTTMSPGVLEFTSADDVFTAYEIIDGVDEVRTNLEEAQFGIDGVPNSGGNLSKAIGKKLGFSGKDLNDFEPTYAQSLAYIDEIVSKSADKAHAKAMVVIGWAAFEALRHQQASDPFGHGDS